MMDPVPDLLGIIREEIVLCRDLVEHATQKTSLLVQGSVEEILENDKIEQTLSSKLCLLEKETKRLCLDLGRAFRIPNEEFTLMKLADHLEPPLALELRSQAALFRDLAQQLKSISRRNMKLIEKSMKCFRDILSLMCNVSGSYRQNGFFEQLPSVQPTFSQQA
jgi:hypothetical protein